MELSVYLGRMPIMKSDGSIFAYELLHRSTDANHTIVDDNVKATARVLVNALNYIGLHSLTGYKPAFIKVDEKAVFDDLIFSISEKHFVLEILEESLVSSALVKRVQELHKKGYKFALNHYKSDDDFLLHFKALLPFVSYIKIDLKKDTKERVLTMLEQLSSLDAHYIAEKVEEKDEFEWAKEAGFHYFQGYYFSKPQIYIREMLDPDNQTLLNLIYLLKKEASFDEILSVFNDSPYLSINLLKFIHLHHGPKEEKIASIDQALILLGRDRLTHWIELMVYAQGDDEYNNDTVAVSPLGKIAKSRAVMMEALAHIIADSSELSLSTSAYLVGILSLAEAIFQSSFEKLFMQMDLEHSISEALTSKEGVLGDLLKLCVAVETNDFKEITRILTKLDISQEQLNMAMMLAYRRSSGS